jgi:hypothetical protein
MHIVKEEKNVLSASSALQPKMTHSWTSAKKVVSAQRQATSVEEQALLTKLSSKQVTYSSDLLAPIAQASLGG